MHKNANDILCHFKPVTSFAYLFILLFQSKNSILLKDCTVRLDFELEDGTTIEGEITFVDVSWWDCTKMQLAAWWERNF